MDWSKISESKPDWLAKQCDRVFATLSDLSLKQRLMVIEQVMEYLRQEEVCDSTA